MRTSRSTAIAPPFGAIEKMRPCRELSALTDLDLATPAIIRRGSDRWGSIDEATRLDMKRVLVQYYTRKLGDARFHLRLLLCIGAAPRAAVERVAKFEQLLERARGLA